MRYTGARRLIINQQVTTPSPPIHLWQLIPLCQDRRHKESLLDHVDIPQRQTHMIPAELGAEKAALAYARVVKEALPFDLVLLGIGEDGHTASLFPQHKYPSDTMIQVVHDAPKPPSDRVSMSTNCLNNTYASLLIITGKSKQNAIRLWHSGEDLPVAHISAKESLQVMLDHEAFGGLD